MAKQTDISGFVASLRGPVRQRIEQAAIAGTDEVAEAILARARELCPVSATNPWATSETTGRKIRNPYYTGTSGALRDSGTVTPAELRGLQIVAEVGFHTDYAAAVHERLDASHKYPGAVNPQAQAKFLEAAANEIGPKAPEHVLGRMQQAMSQGDA